MKARHRYIAIFSYLSFSKNKGNPEAICKKKMGFFYKEEEEEEGQMDRCTVGILLQAISSETQ